MPDNIELMWIPTTTKVTNNPLTVEHSGAIVGTYLSRSSVAVPQPTNGHHDVVVEHGAPMMSFDNDFSRVADLTWELSAAD